METRKRKTSEDNKKDSRISPNYLKRFLDETAGKYNALILYDVYEYSWEDFWGIIEDSLISRGFTVEVRDTSKKSPQWMTYSKGDDSHMIEFRPTCAAHFELTPPCKCGVLWPGTMMSDDFMNVGKLAQRCQDPDDKLYVLTF